MKKIMLFLVIMLSCMSFCIPVYAQKGEADENWGIGLQVNYPLLGGISVRYYGLSPVYLQIIGRFIMNGDERDNMLGGGISYAVFEHKSSQGEMTRLYFSLVGGERYEKNEEIEYIWDEEFGREETRILAKKTYGAGITFGVEFAIPFLGALMGCNAEIGQGYGRVEENSETKDTASFILGGGIHFYF